MSATVTVSDTSGNPVSGAAVTLDAVCQGGSTADLLPGVAITSVYSSPDPYPTGTTDATGSASFPAAVVACTASKITASVIPPTSNSLRTKSPPPARSPPT